MIAESTACRKAALAGRLAFLNTGSLGATAARLYGDPRPASADEWPASAMLIEIPLQDPAGLVANGALTLLPREPGMIVHSGLATWARFVNRDGVPAFDREAGEVGSGAECELTITTLGAGGVVAITSGAPVGWAASWERGARASVGIEHGLPGRLCRMPIDRSVRHRDGSGLGASMAAAHQEATRVWQDRVGIFQGADSRHDGARLRRQDGDRTSRTSRETAWQVSTRHRRSNGSGFEVATPFSPAWQGRFQEAGVPPIGIRVVRPPEPPVPSPCDTPSGQLVFALPGRADAHLVFVCDASPGHPGTTVVVSVRRGYLVLNDVSLHRLIDGVEVPVLTLWLSLDAGSWTWGFDAVLAATGIIEPGAFVEYQDGSVTRLGMVRATHVEAGLPEV